MRAVIDVGSNSVLLLVADQRDGAWQTIFESSEVTGLGRQTKATGLLSEEGMTSTLEALRRGFDKARFLGCENITAAATMAARIAKNQAEFLSRADEQDTPVVILSGDREAELGFLAVANDPIFATEERLSIIDPGGNSTELMTARRGDEWAVEFKKSFPVGALGLRDSLEGRESLGPREMLQLVEEIDDIVGLRYLPGQSGRAVVLGATGTNLITIREKMTEWLPERVHGQVLDFEEVSKAVGWLCPMTDAERAGIVGIEKGRERTLHLGALILERFLQAIHVLDVTVSVRGWRHALLETTA